MKKNIKLDSFTCQEIKELIYDNKIELVSLETSVLQRLMDNEIGLLCFGEGDEELIDKCSDIICDRDSSVMPREHFLSLTDKVLKENTKQAHKAIRTKRFSLKRALVIAAAVSAIVIGGTMVASAFGFNIFEYIDQIARQSEGTEKEENGLTFYNGGETKEYESLKDAVEKEKLNIMYPTSLPDSVVIKAIQILNSDLGDKNIQFLTNDSSILIIVDTSVAPTDNAFQGKKLYHKDGVDYILYENETEYKFAAYCNVNNCAYTIQAKEYEDLIYVIENMEENQ